MGPETETTNVKLFSVKRFKHIQSFGKMGVCQFLSKSIKINYYCWNELVKLFGRYKTHQTTTESANGFCALLKIKKLIERHQKMTLS